MTSSSATTTTTPPASNRSHARSAEKHGLRVWLDKWEIGPGQAACRSAKSVSATAASRSLSVSQKALELEVGGLGDQEAPGVQSGGRSAAAREVRAARASAGDWTICSGLISPTRRKTPRAPRCWRGYIRSADAEDARRRRGFRPPPDHGQPGAFPRPPRYGFQGRARELYELERAFRRQRGIVLHAMGGMGKTSLATEAAHWWTRSGLFRDGACFVSFEQFASADRVMPVLGEYCEGPKFHQRPATEQRRRAIEFFRRRAVLMVWDNYESVLPQFNEGAAAARQPLHRRRTPPSGRSLPRPDHRHRARAACSSPAVRARPELPGAVRFELHGLARADSLWLLHRILERDGVTLDDPRLARDKLDPLLRDLADHPLSLELVGPHLRTHDSGADSARTSASCVESMTADSDQERNTSLLASLEFSRRHLSAAARAALPWLGLFRGGVFEEHLPDVSQIDPAAWEPIRRELQGIALCGRRTTSSSPAAPSSASTPRSPSPPPIPLSRPTRRRASDFIESIAPSCGRWTRH